MFTTLQDFADLPNICGDGQGREYLRGKYHCTIDLLFDWFGLVCFENKNKNYQLSYSWFQTSQTGGRRYSDTSPFSIPWPGHCIHKTSYINHKDILWGALAIKS